MLSPRAHARSCPNAHVPPNRRPLALWKKLLFGLLPTALLLGLAEALLALAGVQPELVARDPYVGFASNVALSCSQPVKSGARRSLISCAFPSFQLSKR